MARRRRRKQNGVIGTILVELSALAGIFGVAQPALRDNLWRAIQPSIVSASPPTYQELSEVESFERDQSSRENFLSNLPSAYTAQAILPPFSNSPSAWSESGYNPMGSYQ